MYELIIVVAIPDSGIDYSHPDLISNTWKNEGEIPENQIDDDRKDLSTLSRMEFYRKIQILSIMITGMALIVPVLSSLEKNIPIRED